MKKTKKVLLLGLCAVLLVAASVLGTMAYLTSTDEVVNTFTVGKVIITLDEARVGSDGKKVDPETRVKENDYKLMPGHEYDKDPTVHVDEKSENCYLFVTVDNQIAGIEDAPTVATQMEDKGWTNVTDNVYVYTNKTGSPVAVSANDNVKVFEKFTIAGTTVDNAKLGEFDGKKITVKAYAVQADGFNGKSASTIWDEAGFTNNN